MAPSEKSKSRRSRRNVSKTPPRLEQIDSPTSNKKVMLCVKFKNDEIEKKMEEAKEMAESLATLEQELQERVTRAKVTEKELANKEISLEKLKCDFEMKSGQLIEKEAVFNRKCLQIDQQDKDLDKKRKANDDMHATLDKKESELEKKDAMLIKRNFNIDEKIKEFKAKELEVLRINNEIHSKTLDLNALAKEVEKKKLDSEKTLLKSKDKLENDISLLETKSGDLDKKFKANQEKTKNATEELKDVEGDLRTSKTELRNAERNADRKTKELERKDRELNTTRDQFKKTNVEFKSAQLGLGKIKPLFVKQRMRLLVNNIHLFKLRPLWNALQKNSTDIVRNALASKTYQDANLAVNESLLEDHRGEMAVQTTPLSVRLVGACQTGQNFSPEAKSEDPILGGLDKLAKIVGRASNNWRANNYECFLENVSDLQHRDYLRFKTIQKLTSRLEILPAGNLRDRKLAPAFKTLRRNYSAKINQSSVKHNLSHVHSSPGKCCAYDQSNVLDNTEIRDSMMFKEAAKSNSNIYVQRSVMNWNTGLFLLKKISHQLDRKMKYLVLDILAEAKIEDGDSEVSFVKLTNFELGQDSPCGSERSRERALDVEDEDFSTNKIEIKFMMSNDDIQVPRGPKLSGDLPPIDEESSRRLIEDADQSELFKKKDIGTVESDIDRRMGSLTAESEELDRAILEGMGGQGEPQGMMADIANKIADLFNCRKND
jgi:hypothetical protein